MIKVVVMLDTPNPNTSRHNLKELNRILVCISGKYIYKRSIPSRYKSITVLLYLNIFCYVIPVLGLSEQLVTQFLIFLSLSI